MSILDDMPELLNTTILIKKPGAVTGNTVSGPIYAADVTCYSNLGAFYLMSANEALVWDRLGNPSTHNIVIWPSKITSEITPDAWAEIGGITYTLTPGENDILEQEDVATFKAVKRA